MTEAVRPAWNYVEGFLDRTEPSKHRFFGDPSLDMVVGASGSYLALRVPYPPDEPIPITELARVDYESVQVEGEHFLQIRSSTKDLYPYFFDFASSIVDHIQSDALDPVAAVDRAVRDWKHLIERVSGLSQEQVTGLIGELLFLGHLAELTHGEALDAWTGPGADPHDFRLGALEIEVKTTRSQRRVHHISSLGQLAPSPGQALYLASFQIAAAGAAKGFSLAELMTRERQRFSDYGRGEEFVSLIESRFPIEWREIHRYSDRFILRSDPVVCAVGARFPRLTRSDIEALDVDEPQRIVDATYRLDVQGLGTDAKAWIKEVLQ